MTDTTDPTLPRSEAVAVSSTPPVAVDPVSIAVRALDADTVLSEVVAERAAADRSEARVLELAVHYVDLHPVTEQHPAATPFGNTQFQVPDAVGEPVEESLAGVGTPGVAEFAVEELGAVLGVPYATALQLVTDSVELCYRLPRLWSRVQSGRLQAWRARAVARQTTRLPAASVDFVDGQVAILADRRRVPSLGKLRDLVHEARLLVDPDRERGVEEAALSARGCGSTTRRRPRRRRPRRWSRCSTRGTPSTWTAP